mmetsp:Transcript_20399/g.52164  ORF Transcript_20399/g.52164 Transcript_20399/m.52164 type:complete len:223 (-) Transcript_20399:925-1593(-)
MATTPLYRYRSTAFKAMRSSKKSRNMFASIGLSDISRRIVPICVSCRVCAWLWLCPRFSTAPWPWPRDSSSQPGSLQSSPWPWPWASSCPWPRPSWPCPSCVPCPCSCEASLQLGSSQSTSLAPSTSPRPFASPSLVSRCPAENPFRASSSPTGTSSGFVDKLHVWIETTELTPLIAAMVSRSLSGLTMSTLLSKTLSAKATCCAGSFTVSSDLSLEIWSRK